MCHVAAWCNSGEYEIYTYTGFIVGGGRFAHVHLQGSSLKPEQMTPALTLRCSYLPPVIHHIYQPKATKHLSLMLSYRGIAQLVPSFFPHPRLT